MNKLGWQWHFKDEQPKPNLFGINAISKKYGKARAFDFTNASVPDEIKAIKGELNKLISRSMLKAKHVSMRTRSQTFLFKCVKNY